MGRALGHLVDHKAGIHAGGQEAAHLHIGDLVGSHALGKGVGDALFPLLQRGLLVHMVADVVIPLHIQFTGFPGEHMGAGQLVDVFEHGLRVGDILHAQILGQALLVELLAEAGWARKLLISEPNRNRPSTL